MDTNRSRREFIKQACILAAASGFGLRKAYGAETAFVAAETTYGKIRGMDRAGIKVFKGVPYGASTAGKNRCMPPLEPAKWTGVRDALEFGSSAPQSEPGVRRATAARAVAAAGLPAESEDCLVLNIWTPALGDGRKRPVMLWCHGGGFSTGSGSSQVTDGTNLARRGDVVVVSINHRLNVLGFTFLGELGGSEFSSSGDAGMLDIVHALKWIDDTFWGVVPQKRVRFMGYDSGIKPGENACTVAGCTADHGEAGKVVDSKIGYYAPLKENTNRFVKRG